MTSTPRAPIALSRPLRLSNAIHDTQKMQEQTVSGDECIAHLKLLEVFSDLREVISHRDGLWGLWDSQAIGTVKTESLSQLAETQLKNLVKIRERRWAIYVSRAVDRFESWFFKIWPSNVWPTPSGELTATYLVEHQDSMSETPTRASRLSEWKAEYLPPVGNLLSFDPVVT